ncbi:ADP ribosyltransferase [Flavobacteriaceae bacterium]
MNDENFYTNLSEIQKTVFDKYKGNTDGFCYKLNDGLRLRNAVEFINEIETLDGIINLHQSTEEIILHRATNECQILPFIENNIYTNPEYISTTIDLESVQTHFTNPFNPVYITFTCAIGTNMAPFEGNELFGGTEGEILLGRENVFTIISNRVTRNKVEIESVMERDKADGVDQLRMIKVTNIVCPEGND